MSAIEFLRKRHQRDEEGEPAFSCETIRLLLHLGRFSGSRLRQQDDPGVLQQIRPADVRAEFGSAPRKERLDVFEFGVRKLVESSLKIDKSCHARLGVNIWRSSIRSIMGRHSRNSR